MISAGLTTPTAANGESESASATTADEELIAIPGTSHRVPRLLIRAGLQTLCYAAGDGGCVGLGACANDSVRLCDEYKMRAVEFLVCGCSQVTDWCLVCECFTGGWGCMQAADGIGSA